MDSRVQKMADVLINYSVDTKPGDWVVIRTPMLGEPMARACTEAVTKAGGHPFTILMSEDIQETFLREASEEQLKFIAPYLKMTVEEADAMVNIMAPTNTRTMAESDPEKWPFRTRPANR